MSRSSIHQTPYWTTRALRVITAVTIVANQLAFPSSAAAAGSGSSNASAGSALPPGMTAVQSFQPDLFSGRAAMSLPLVVPPGRRNMQPELTLTYSSSGRNGWLGMGWSLESGYIERSTKNGVPTYTASDIFVLQFQGVNSELVKVPDGTYRAKDEGAFLRFTFDGTQWQATDKAGTTYLFGQTAGARLQDGPNMFRWALEKVTDSNGNLMTYTYAPDAGQLYLDHISYTQPAIGVNPTHQVDFVIESGRPDVETSYRSGFGITTAKRLRGVTMFALGQHVRTYEFTYEIGGRTGRSLLKSVGQIGTDRLTRFPVMTTFAYQSTTLPSYTILSNPTNFTSTTLAGDFNGDGLTDLAVVDLSNGTWKVLLTLRAGGFAAPVTWLSGFGANQTPVVGDWDQDGRTDIGAFSAGAWQFQRSDGVSSFQPASPATFNTSPGVPIAGDFNGDGATDIGSYNNGTWNIWLRQGTTFVATTSFTTSWGGTDYQPLTGDFNGDGLTDAGIVYRPTGGVDVRLSDGGALTSPSTWIFNFGAGADHLVGDFNGDGFSDVAYYNWSSKQMVYAPSTGIAPPAGNGFGAAKVIGPTFTLGTPATQGQAADFNGDSLADPAVFEGASGELGLSNGTIADLLVRVDNGLGGTTTLSYLPSGQLDNTGSDNKPDLPFIVPVVSAVTADDSRAHTYTTTYSYRDGSYDSSTKEFRGFGHVEVTDPDGNVTLTDFHQDQMKKGRPFHTELRNAAGARWSSQDQTWSVTDPFAGVETHFVKLDVQTDTSCDGDATCQSVQRHVTYDAYGNVTKLVEDGDPTTTGDERTTETTYVYNTTKWILDKPRLIIRRDSAGVAVTQRQFFYDGATDSTVAPTKGNLTRQEDWLKGDPSIPTPDQWIPTTMTYDAYGNLASLADALNVNTSRTTTYTYDPTTATYLNVLTNPLQFTQRFTYDAKFGVVTSATDENGQVATTTYDIFGRVVNIISPLDTASAPTATYTYAPAAPISKTTRCDRIQSGGTTSLCSSTFTDGLGRTLQVRAPAKTATQQIVSGEAEYDGRGLVSKQWPPYMDATSNTYVPHTFVAGVPTPAQYTYDPTGRVTKTIDSSGGTTLTSYNDRTVTLTDPNTHVVRRRLDSAGRVRTVEEVNGAAVYQTTYSYDTLNRLVQVTDAKNSALRMTMAYDTLGRRLSLDDPDGGRWTSTFDAVDRMISQTDARGVKTDFTYDALDRLTKKAYTVPAGSTIPDTTDASYTYDGAGSFTRGRLTSVSDSGGSTTFAYDALGRTIRETKTIDSVAYTVQRTYDLLGRVTSLTYPTGDVARYTYAGQGSLDKLDLQPAGSTSTQSMVSGMDYTAGGLPTRIAYGNGVTTTYQYNPLTLRLERLSSVKGTTSLQDFQYTFDSVGNLSQLKDLVYTATQTFTYDPLDRLTQAVGTSYGTKTYSYDAIGNLTAKEGVTHTYGGPRPHAITSTSSGWALTYDANGNLTKKVTDSRAAVTDLLAQYLTVDAANRLTEVKTPETQTATLTFQPGWNFFSLPVMPDDLTISTLFPDFSTQFSQISRDDAGTFKHYVGTAKFNGFTSLDYGTGYQAYCKSATAVNVSFTGKLPTQGLSLPLANGWFLLAGLTLKTSETTAAIFGSLSADKIERYDAATGTTPVTTTVQKGGAYYVHLPAADTWTPPVPKDLRTSIVYDTNGGRVKKTSPAGTTIYVGDLYEKLPSGTSTIYFLVGPQRVAAKDSTGAIRFYHADQLGSTHVVTDSAGVLVELNEYLPYGAISRHQGPADVPQKFTGQRLDPETGLLFYQSRYYDPALGRFISPDTIVPNQYNPQHLNRYSYADNNPVTYSDPTGHFKFKDFFRRFAGTIVSVALMFVGVPPIAGGIIGAAIGTVANHGGLADFAVGVAIGTIAGMVAGSASGMLARTVGMNLAGIETAMFRGAVGGAVGGALGSAIYGQNIGYSMLAGAATGSAIGAVDWGVQRVVTERFIRYTHVGSRDSLAVHPEDIAKDTAKLKQAVREYGQSPQALQLMLKVMRSGRPVEIQAIGGPQGNLTDHWIIRLNTQYTDTSRPAYEQATTRDLATSLAHEMGHLDIIRGTTAGYNRSVEEPLTSARYENVYRSWIGTPLRTGYFADGDVTR